MSASAHGHVVSLDHHSHQRLEFIGYHQVGSTSHDEEGHVSVVKRAYNIDHSVRRATPDDGTRHPAEAERRQIRESGMRAELHPL